MQVIRDFPLPNSHRKRCKFLGLVNFYRSFLPHAADLLHPLTQLLGSSKEGTKAVIWTDKAREAFDATKEALASATLSTHPQPNPELAIMTDASDVAVGAVLQQQVADQWHPISYFSKKLKPAEVRYSTFDCELLAVYLSIRHFRYMVEGREFCVYTDHKPLTRALTSRSTQHSPRQVCHLDFVSQFTSDIRHVKGSKNPVADALSWIELNTLTQHQGIVFDDMAWLEYKPMTQTWQTSNMSHPPSNLRRFLYRRQTLQSSVTFPQERHDHLSPNHSGAPCSIRFTPSRTLEYEPQSA